MQGTFRFSFGPWNIHEGADPFGPEVRNTIPFNKKLESYKKMGFDGIQFHDDDAVPNMANLTPEVKEEMQKALKWAKEKCIIGFDKNPDFIRDDETEKEKQFEFAVKMAVII